MRISDRCFNYTSSCTNLILHKKTESESYLSFIIKKVVGVVGLIFPGLFCFAIGYAMKAVEHCFSKEKKPENISQLLSKESKGLSHLSSSEILLYSIAKKEEHEQVLSTLKEIDFSAKKGSFAHFEPELIIKFFEKVEKVKFEQSVNTANKISLEIIERMDSLFFHGTHAKHLDSIRKKGLSIDHGDINPDIKKIHKIFRQALRERPNEIDPIFYLTSDVANAISCSKKSPDWFYRFAGSHYPKRNKEKARQHLEERIQQWQTQDKAKLEEFGYKRAITDSEAKQIREFFETTWEHYKEYRPVVIKVTHPVSTCSAEEILDLAFQIKNINKSEATPKQYREALGMFFERRRIRSNFSVNKTIPPKNLEYFFIPN